MRLAVCGLMILVAALPCAAAEAFGTWEGTLQHGSEKIHAGFDLDLSGGKISGDAFVEGWGYSLVSDGRVEGDRVRFTVDRKFTGTGPVTKIEFEGVLAAHSMVVTMTDGAKYEGTLDRVESHVNEPLSVDAAPQVLEGKWTARWVGPLAQRPKMIGKIEFEFHVDGNTLTGIAHMKGWPGDCPISEGKIEHGKFSFTATGRSSSSSGIPVLGFEGEIHGQQLKLAMRHQIFGPDNGVGLPMDASRM